MTRVRIGAPGPVTASANLLGMNLDPDRAEGREGQDGIQSERLVNPLFRSPSDRLGIAAGWSADAFTPPFGGFAGQHFRLVTGLNGPGRNVQMISNTGGGEIGMVQSNLWVRAAEELELVVRVRSQYSSVPLRVGLRPLSRHADDYVSAVIDVAPAQWGRYTVRLAVPVDDDNCVLFIKVQGRGLVWIDQVHLAPAGADVLREDFTDCVRQMDVPVVRFPGSGGLMHRWHLGIGPRDTRPDEEFETLMGDWTPAYGFGTDEYLTWCQDLNILPHIAVNISTGSSQEAEEWAAYVADWYRDRGLELPPIYWQIGNEPWLPYDLAHQTPESYARTLEAYVPRIRARYPRARIVGAAQSWCWDDSFDFRDSADGTGRSGSRHPWRSRLLSVVDPANLDVLGMQLYTYPYDNDEQEEYFRVFDCAKEFEDDIRAAVRDANRFGLASRIGITEWNLWIHANAWDGRGFYEPYSLEHVLYFSDVVHRMVANAQNVELANFYCLNGPMRVLDVQGPRIHQTDLVKAYELYRPAFPGRVAPVEIESSKIEDRDIEAISGVALFDSKTTGSILLVNRQPTEGVLLELDNVRVSGGEGLSGRTARGRVSEFELPIDHVSGSASDVTIPPASLSRLRFEVE